MTACNAEIVAKQAEPKMRKKKRTRLGPARNPSADCVHLMSAFDAGLPRDDRRHQDRVRRAPRQHRVSHLPHVLGPVRTEHGAAVFRWATEQPACQTPAGKFYKDPDLWPFILQEDVPDVRLAPGTGQRRDHCLRWERDTEQTIVPNGAHRRPRACSCAAPYHAEPSIMHGSPVGWSANRL